MTQKWMDSIKLYQLTPWFENFLSLIIIYLILNTHVGIDYNRISIPLLKEHIPSINDDIPTETFG